MNNLVKLKIIVIFTEKHLLFRGSVYVLFVQSSLFLEFEPKNIRIPYVIRIQQVK